MIKTEFYATQSTYNEFESTGKITDFSTSAYPNLTDKTIDPLGAYYMGTTPADKTLFNYEYTVDDTDEHNFIFKSESLHVKPKWLYGMAGSTDQNHAVAWNGTRWIGATNLINSMYPYYYNQFKTVTVSFVLLVKNYSQTLVNTGVVYVCHVSTSAVQLQFTPGEIFDFFENGATKSIVIDGHAITFSMSDWSENGLFFDVGNDMRLYVNTVDITTTEQSGHYYPGSGMKFYGMQTIGTADADNSKIGCIYGQTCNYYTYADIRLDFTSTFNLTTSSYTQDASVYTVTNGDKWFGNIRPFEIGQDACEYCRQHDIGGGNTNNRLLLPDDTLLDYAGTSGSSYFVRINQNMCNFLGWYQTLYCLLPKIATDKNADGTAATPDTYSNVYNPYNAVPVFNGNVPTGHMVKKSGYNDLQPLLMTWQQYGMNINDDDFDPGVTPTPPRPVPEDVGDEETGGYDVEMNDPSGLGNGFGFTTMYGLRGAHLQEIGNKLWDGFTNVNNYINNFIFAVNPTTGSVNMSDLMQFFISLRAYPCSISVMASTSAGGTDMYIGSGAAPLSLVTPFSVVDSYIGHVDLGSVDLPLWYGDYRDYDLEIICYLPYCGTVQLNAGDVMGGTLYAYYTVDFCSGACMGYIMCDTWEGSTVLVGSLPGQLGADIPMTATNAGQVMARMYGDRINVAENLLGTAKNAATGIGAIMSGNAAGAIRSGIGAFIDPAIANERQLADMGQRGAIAAPMLSGGRGLAGFGTCVSAWVQVRSPYYTAPENYDAAVGVPASSAVRIGDCSGFCQFVNVDVTGITTDADDQQAIRAALESGVII